MKHFDLSMIYCLLKAIVSSTYDTVVPATNWVIELKDDNQKNWKQ